MPFVLEQAEFPGRADRSEAECENHGHPLTRGWRGWLLRQSFTLEGDGRDARVETACHIGRVDLAADLRGLAFNRRGSASPAPRDASGAALSA